MENRKLQIPSFLTKDLSDYRAIKIALPSASPKL